MFNVSQRYNLTKILTEKRSEIRQSLLQNPEIKFKLFTEAKLSFPYVVIRELKHARF